MSVMLVRPTDRSQSWQRSSHGRRGGSSWGITSSSSWADSRRMPVGSPDASRTISPPTGSGVSRVMPARCSASEFAQIVCPSTLDSAATRSPETASRECRSGCTGTAQRLWFHRPLCSHSSSASPSAWVRTSWSASSSDRASRRSTDDRSRESHSVWMWASWRPGITTAPGRSTDLAPPAAESASAPTATMRPSSTSRASVQGSPAWPASPVQMRSCRKRVCVMRWAPG